MTVRPERVRAFVDYTEVRGGVDEATVGQIEPDWELLTRWLGGEAVSEASGVPPSALRYEGASVYVAVTRSPCAPTCSGRPGRASSTGRSWSRPIPASPPWPSSSQDGATGSSTPGFRRAAGSSPRRALLQWMCAHTWSGWGARESWPGWTTRAAVASATHAADPNTWPRASRGRYSRGQCSTGREGTHGLAPHDPAADAPHLRAHQLRIGLRLMVVTGALRPGACRSARSADAQR